VKKKTSRYRQKGKKHEIRRSQPQGQRSSQLPRAVAGGWAEFGAHAVSRSDGQISQLQLRQHHADCEAKPDATNVAGLRTWNSLGRFVRRGEKGIFILAPMVGNKRNKEENVEQNTDAKETQRTLYGFRGVYVFDRLSRDLWPSLCAPDRSRL
jgi:hypothetical protein